MRNRAHKLYIYLSIYLSVYLSIYLYILRHPHDWVWQTCKQKWILHTCIYLVFVLKNKRFGKSDYRRTPQDTPRTLQDTTGHLYFRILTLNNSTYDGKESQINNICPKYSIFSSGNSIIICVYYYCCINDYQCCTGHPRTLYYCSNNLNASLNTTKLCKLSVIINKSLNLIHSLSFISE